jgi:hypothetical protein
MSALQPSQTIRDRWDKTLAAHLLNRAGFGGLPEDVAQAANWGMERTVDYLLDFEKTPESFPVPETPETPKRPKQMFADLSKEERQQKVRELLRSNREAIEETRGWWIKRMLTTKRPLQEKMTLFWHGHFATSANDVKSARHMLVQNEFLRKNCLGHFRTLLRGISRDPAMLKYLDNNTNRKQHPNENYAREFMELFTIGIGNYSEDDVKVAARAFTGWTFRGDEFTVIDRQHDYGRKTFLGVTGDLDGTDIIDIILKQPATVRFMARKLFEFFVYSNPEPPLVEELAALLRRTDYEIKPFLRTLFTSEVFYSPPAYRTQIKSPAQLVVGSVRNLGVTINERALAVAMRMLGQDLLYPPNVKGWDGGEAWINTNTLLMRYNMAGYLVEGKIPEGGRQPRIQGQRGMRLSRFGSPKSTLDKMYGPEIAADAPKLVDALVARLLQAPLDGAARNMLISYTERARVSERPATVAHLIMSMPDYQLC